MEKELKGITGEVTDKIILLLLFYRVLSGVLCSLGENYCLIENLINWLKKIIYFKNFELKIFDRKLKLNFVKN